MWTYDLMGTCVLVLTLLTILVMVLLLRQRRTQKDAPVWLLSTVVGILLGAAGAAAAVQLLGYSLMTTRAGPAQTGDAAGGSGTTAPPMGSGTMGPGAPGGMGMGGGMGGGTRAPSPKRELTTLVRKINLLTGDIALKLTPEQAVSLSKSLQSLQAKEKMTDDEAKAAHEELLALFDADQKAKQDAIDLPRRGGGGGPRGSGGGPGGSGGGPPADEDANPFKQEQNAEAIQSLRARFGTPGPEKPTGEKPAAGKAAKDKPTEPPAPTAPAAKSP